MKRLSIVFVAAALAASCANVPPRTSPVAPPERLVADPDYALAGAVYSKLNTNPVYYYRHVDVRVDGGVAYLSGYVWSADAIYAARRIAGSVPGITGVVAIQLELERNGRGNGATR